MSFGKLYELIEDLQILSTVMSILSFFFEANSQFSDINGSFDIQEEMKFEYFE